MVLNKTDKLGRIINLRVDWQKEKEVIAYIYKQIFVFGHFYICVLPRALEIIELSAVMIFYLQMHATASFMLTVIQDIKNGMEIYFIPSSHYYQKELS